MARIAVLRGGGLGDVLGALPALDALASAYPDAELILLTEPGHLPLLTGRPSAVSRVVGLPPARGVYEPDGDADGESPSWTAFRQEISRRPIDLGVQLHGGGRWSNPFLLRLQPRWTVGTRTSDAAALTRCLPYRYYQPEVMRWLEVVGLAGAPPVTWEPHLVVTSADLAAAGTVLDDHAASVVVFHPGARDPRRRWPPEHFADVVSRCVRAGARAVLVGTSAESELLHDIWRRAGRRLSAGAGDAVAVLDRIDVSTLCGVLALSDVVVANDSGVRHLAHAVGTQTVGIYWIGNAINTGPLTRVRHRMLMAWTTRCPVCGRDCTRIDVPRCEHDVSFVADVSPDDVMDEVSQLLGWR